MSALAVLPHARAQSGPRLHLDTATVSANTRHFVDTTGPVMAVVKADGFGHGASAMARAALCGGATWLGVTSLAEATALRADGLTAPILSWLNPPDADFAGALEASIDLAVPSLPHLEAVLDAATTTGRRARVHLHLDTGMARDGADPEEWRPLVARLRSASDRGLIDMIGLMGHLGCADQPGHPANALGRRAFLRGSALVRRAGLRPRVRHLAATAAALTAPRSRFDLVRIGAGLVGIDPSGCAPLREALMLTAPVVAVRHVRAGTGVGYGHTHVTRRRTHLGLVPLGYADGLPRRAAGRAEVLVAGRRAPVVGQVSMDQIVVDLGAAPVVPGTTAVVFGPGADGEPTVADWARWSDTIPHEILTRLGARIGR